MKENVRYEFPMEQYLPAWKLFRYLSDENEVTARHILNLNSWNYPKRILDIGCGDGLLLKALTHLGDNGTEEVILLDPDTELLVTAVNNIKETNIIPKIVAINDDIINCIPDIYKGVDAVLAIHIAYLIPNERFKRVIRELPEETICYLVLDDLSSVFSNLWKETAPKYYERAEQTHDFVSKLDASAFEIKQTYISSKIKNPLKLKKHFKESILSILCYNDFPKFDISLKKYVEDTVGNYIKEDFIYCKSACIEIKKKRYTQYNQ